MTQLIPNGKQQFVDQNGRPLVGGQVFFYSVGTTTPKNTYQDSAELILNTNPVILDARGQASIYGNGNYRQILKTAFGVTIWDQVVLDPALAANAFVADIQNSTDISKGDALVAVKQPFTGSRARTQHDLNADLISAADFAVGDGATNDQAAFDQMAINFPGARIDLGRRTYVLNTMPSGCVFVNGTYSISGTSYEANQDAATISGASSTGAYLPPYTGGVNNTPTFSGRDTVVNRVIIACSNCIVDFVRGAAIASIYTRVKANVGAALAARNCFVDGPQASAISSEEAQCYGFRSVNWATAFCIAMGSTIGNILSRNGRASGTLSGNMATESCQIGGGKNALLDVTVDVNGVPTIVITRPGIGYNPATDPISMTDRSSTGTGAAAVTYTVDGTGALTSVSAPGGTGYSVNTEAIITCGVDNSMNIASLLSRVLLGSENANVATDGCDASGRSGGNIFSSGSTASNSRGANVSTTGGIASGAGAINIGGNIVQSTADQAMTLSSRRTINNLLRSVGGGDLAAGSASTANMTWRINCVTGAMSIKSVLTQNAVFTDIAKMFENKERIEIPVGALVSLDGRRVRLAVAGDTWLSAHSRHYVQLMGGDEFSWAHRYVTDAFGETQYEDLACVSWDTPDSNYSGSLEEALELYGQLPAEAVYCVERVAKQSPLYDPSAADSHVPRIERRIEWTPIAMLGEVHVRVDETVLVNGYVAAGETPGIGTNGDKGLRCMEIRQAYDAALGYAIALCLVTN